MPPIHAPISLHLYTPLFFCSTKGTDYHTFETFGRSHKGQVLLVLLWGFAECGFRKALRLRAQGVYSCK